MPLFKKSTDPTPTTALPPSTTTNYNNPRTSTSSSKRSHGLFSSKRRTSSTSSLSSDDFNHHHSRTSNSHAHTQSTPSGGISNLFHRTSTHEDPSILAARQRVESAEKAEIEADRALVQARAAVADARQHVVNLEREAAEDARLAKIKQGQAADLGRRAKPLGRHGF